MSNNKEKEPKGVPLHGMTSNTRVTELKQKFSQMPAEDISSYVTEALRADENSNEIPDVLESHGQFTIQDLLAVVQAMKTDGDSSTDEKAGIIESVLQTESKANTKVGGVIETLLNFPPIYYLPYNKSRERDNEKNQKVKKVHMVHSFKLF